MAKLEARKTAKQKKKYNKRKDLADLAEKKNKRDGSLEKETVNTDALEKENVEKEVRDSTIEFPLPALQGAQGPATAATST